MAEIITELGDLVGGKVIFLNQKSRYYIYKGEDIFVIDNKKTECEQLYDFCCRVLEAKNSRSGIEWQQSL